jgi:hypothetical protein
LPSMMLRPSRRSSLASHVRGRALKGPPDVSTDHGRQLT